MCVLRSITLAVAFVVSVQSAVQAQQARAPEGPVVTRQTTFEIPFSVSQDEQTGQQPIEVQLHMSPDGGATWRLYGRQHPTASRFQFRADRDGEYWFAVRTVDPVGHVSPQGPLQPELKVTVDTTPPALDLSAQTGPDGEIRVQWKSKDSDIPPNGFKLSYQPGEDRSWQPVATESPRRIVAPDGSDVTWGQYVWWPRTRTPSVQIQGELRDHAGNWTVIHRKVSLSDRPPTDHTENKPIDSVPAHNAADVIQIRPDGSVDWPSEGYAEPARSSDAPQRSTTPPGDSQSGRATRGRVSTVSTTRVQGQETTTHAILPTDQTPLTSNSRRFNLEYDVESIGPSGVREVQLWATRDGGHSWKQWTVDQDRQSPAMVVVDADGDYGFRIVIKNGHGLAERPPQPGDEADVWVRVDSTEPRAELTSARYGTGVQSGQLQIHWTAIDTNLNDRSVSLRYSNNPSGPWRTIASDMPNTGRYDWLIDERVPPRFYLRLEVRDTAGNVAVHDLAEPISSHGLAPKGRIRKIRPIHDPRVGSYHIRARR